MGDNISEEKQRELFIRQWVDEEIQLICEVPVFCRSIDLVKYNRHQHTISAVEFKTQNWKRAMKQVLSTAIAFDYVEICVRKPKTTKAQEHVIKSCIDIGVGVYFFDTVEVAFEHIVLPERVEKIWNVQKSQVIDLIMKGESHVG